MLAEILNGHVYNDTAKAFYERNKGKSCLYKRSMNGFVAGYVEHYVIIGFTDKQGCIKSFSDHVEYDSSYESYHFSKLNHITIPLKEKITEDNINDLKVGDVIEYHNGYCWKETVVDDFIIERHFFPTGIGNEACDLLNPLFGKHTYLIKQTL